MSAEATVGERGPIFIGGLSGSGKTHIRRVLGAHPEISMTRRNYLWNRFYQRFGALGDRNNLDRCLSAMAADCDVQRLDPDWDRLRREFVEGDASYARLFGLMHDHHAQRSGTRRWGEQLRFVECFASPIFAAFPTARMIHMVRDPRVSDTTNGRPLVAKPGKLGWETALWLHSAEIALENRGRYPENYRVVRYETFAADPTEMIEDLCAFIREELTLAMTAVLSTLRFPDSVRCSAASLIDLYAGRTLEDLGYERVARPPARERVAGITAWPLNRATMAAWRVTRGGPLTRRARA
jgi:hypothetical protein